MALVYVLREASSDRYKIGRTKGELGKTIAQLSRGNPRLLTEYHVIQTDEEIAAETYLHHRLRSKRVVDGGGREFFELSTGELDAAIEDAKTYLADFVASKKKADELCDVADDGSVIMPTKEDEEIHEQLCLVREEEDGLCVQRKFMEYKLKLRIDRASALGNLATWKVQTKSTFDQASFQRENPELFSAFQRTSTSRVFRLK